MTFLGGLRSENNGTYHEGLVDSNDKPTFDVNLAALQSKWNELELDAFHDHKSHEPDFYAWFKQYKSDDFRCCTLRSLREDLDLGSPPAAFYKNDSDSINALLKKSLSYQKKNSGGVFNEKVKKIVHQQQCEMEKAVIGYGQYKLRSQFHCLSVSEEKWFRMSQGQRLMYIKKFNSCTVRSCDTATPTSSTTIISQPNEDITVGWFSIQHQEEECSLSVSLEDAISNTNLSYMIVDGIWNKASVLIKESNAIVSAPG